MKNSRGGIVRIAGYFLLAIFSVAVYALLVVPGTLEYSHLAFAAILGFGLLLALLLTEDIWFSYGVCALGAVAMRAGLDSLVSLSGFAFVVRAVLVLLVVSVVMSLYGRIRIGGILAVVLAVSLVWMIAPGEQIRAHNAFWVIDVGPRLYDSRVFDYFPTTEVQIPGGPGVRTLGDPDDSGNEEESPRDRVLRDQELRTRTFVPGEGGLREEDHGSSPLDQSGHYLAFPYYHLRPWGVEAALSTTELIEQTMTLGNAPRLGLNLALDAIAERLEATGGVSDTAILEGVGEVSLAKGRLTVETPSEEALSAPTPATHIVGDIRTHEGRGVAVLGETLQVFSVGEEGLKLSHTLDSDLVEDVALAEFFAADVTGDGRDELLMSSIHSPSRILRPTSEGGWDTLWMANEDDISFRFETVMDRGSDPEIVAQSRSRVRAHPLRYLSGYRLRKDTLVPTWRTMTTLVDVHALDVTGDGREELVGSRFGEHRFWVLARHGIPVIAGVWFLLALVPVALIIYRSRRGLAPLGSRPLLAVVAVLIVSASLAIAGYGHGGEYPSANPAAKESDVDDSVSNDDISDIPPLTSIVDEALENTRREDRFWYTGWIATHHGKRQVNAMFDGTFHMPQGYISNVRVAANPLRLFRWEDTLYSEEDGIWRNEGRAKRDLGPLEGFEWLVNLASEMEREEVGAVLGVPALVYRGEFGMDRWFEACGLAGEIPGEVRDMASRGRVSVEARVEPEARRLMEYSVDFEAPLPGVGWFRQEVFFRMYHFGDPSIEPVDVDEIREHVRRSEERIERTR